MTLAALSLCACSKAPSSDAAHDAGEAAAGAAGAIRAIDFAPIAYFNNACARCHGDYAEFYGEGFAQDYSDDELREIVAEMARGPAMSSLEEAELKALVAYHRALARGEPFLVITQAGADALAGEVSPGARVRATLSSGGAIDARVDGHQWTLRKPDALAEVRSALLTLQARKDGESTRLDPRAAAYSHADRDEGGSL